MDLRVAILLGGSLTLIATFLAGMGKSRGATSLPDFFFAKNSLRLGKVVNLMLSTPFSANGLLYQTFLGYAIGPAAILTQVIWCASYIWLDRYRSRIRALASDRTLHGVIGLRFGHRAELGAAVATITGFLMQVGWEVNVGAAVLSAGFDNSKEFYWSASITLAVVAAAYTMIGGLRGNANANTIQNVIGIGAFMAVGYFLFSSSTTSHSATGWDIGMFGRMVSTLGWVGLVSNAVFSLFWQFVDMSTWQNLAAADKGTGASRSTLWWSAFWILLFPGVLGTGLGMYLRGIEGLDPNTVLPRLVTLVSGNGVLLVTMICGLFCVMLSTLDGLLLSVAFAGTFDIQKRVDAQAVMTWYRQQPDTTSNKPSQDEEIFRKEQSVFFAVRLWILLGALAAAALFVWLTQYRGINMFDLVYVVTIGQLTLLPCVWKCLHEGKADLNGGAASIWSGLIVGIALVAVGIISGRTSQLAWAPCIALALSLGVLLFSRQNSNA